jgi:protein-S-isoprenylcysteine O-methyltransferase Ste14
MQHRGSGQALVVVQFLALAGLVLLAGGSLGETETPAETPVGAVALAVAGLLLGLWALKVNRPGNFNIHPAPREGGHLVETGPYRLIRHPMYVALMMFGASCAWIADSFPGWMLWLTLVCVLAVKALLEEWMLARAHQAYAAYRQRTRSFVPFLF